MSQASPQIATSTPETPPTWKIKLLYDGECPLCVHEVTFLRKRDAGRGLVAFEDIANLNYDPATNGGIDYRTAMGRIHAVLPDGSTVKNVEVFRQVYEVLGMGWIYAITKLPVIGAIANFLYAVWAAYRLPITGRPNLETVVRDRQNRIACQQQGRCHLPE